MEFPVLIPEEIEGLLIISFGEDRTFVLDLLSPDGVLRDDIFFYIVFQPTKEHPPSSLRWDKSS
jgi:hypothetical protein